MKQFATHVLGGPVVTDAPEDVQFVECKPRTLDHPFLRHQGPGLKLFYVGHNDLKQDGTLVWAPAHMPPNEVESAVAYVRVQTDSEVAFSEWLDRREESVEWAALECVVNHEVLLRLHPDSMDTESLDRMVHGVLFKYIDTETKAESYGCDGVRFTSLDVHKIVKPRVDVSHTGTGGKHTISATIVDDTKSVPRPTPKASTITRADTSAKKTPEPLAPGEYRKITMTEIKFVQADMKKGKKFQQVAIMLDMLMEARVTDQPVVPFASMCEKAGAKYPQDVQAAVFALELSGVCDRYTYVEPGSNRTQDAYAIRDDVVTNQKIADAADAPSAE